jgi:hypothetical protein
MEDKALYAKDGDLSGGAYRIVSDGTNNSSLVISSGNIGVGTINPLNSLHLVRADYQVAALQTSNDTYYQRPILTLQRSRGSPGSEATVVGGTYASNLGTVGFNGYDGTNWIEAASIDAIVDGEPGTNDMPTKLVFYTTPDGSVTPQARMTIKNSGNVGVGQTSPDRKLEILDASYPQLRLTQTNDTQFVDLQADSSSNLLIDAGGDIKLDADGGDIEFLDGGTSLLKISNSSSDVVIQPQQTDKDIIFKEDGGTEVMRIDSSAATVQVTAGKLKIGSYWTLEG